MSLYVPGTGETDPKKIIMSLQALAKAITDLQNGATTGTVTEVDTAGLASGGPITTTGTVTVTAASKSDQQTGTSATTVVTPAHQQDHDGVAKAWISFDASGTALGSYNATVSRTSTGNFAVVFTTAFANTNYVAHVTSESPGSSTNALFGIVPTSPAKSASGLTATFLNAGATSFVNPTIGHVVCYGRQ